jgi:hypothetical protein
MATIFNFRFSPRDSYKMTVNKPTKTTTTSGNTFTTGITTTTKETTSFTTTLRHRFGYNAVTTATTTTTVTQAPPLVNNAAPVAPGAPANLYQLENAFAQPPVPRTSTTVSTTTTVTKAVKPRWRLLPVKRGRSISWVWRQG